MRGVALGPYRLVRELGSGGMGTVWLAEGDAGPVALKVVHPHLLSSPGVLERFLREAELGKAVVHENVVRTLDVDACVLDGKPWSFLVMEYVEGQTLRELLEELGRVPEELCRHIGREIGKGLAAIHAAGAVHRDMKPENVLITKEHVVKVMDLGVAHLTGVAQRLSRTGVFVGSIGYAAPEQLRSEGREVDGRADLHALGLILYELTTGQHPYAADDFGEVMRLVLEGAPRRPSELNPQVSSFFEELVLRLLAKDRDGRFESADALVRALEEGEASAWWRTRAKAIRLETRRPLRRMRIPRETALLGRDAELASLRGLYDAARAGDGRVVLVEGEAGIGKSRLVDEFVGLLRREGEDLDFLYGSYPPGGAATASDAFTTAYLEHFGREGLAETLHGHLKHAPLLVPGFAALLTSQAPPAGALALTKDSIQACFVQTIRAIAAERVAVVLIDDLHFAPEEGKALFASLAMAVPGHRILLVGTSRPPLDERWAANITRLPHATRMTVGRLGAKDLVALLTAALRSASLAEDLAGRIAVKSDGNPFFVFEILRGLREGKFLARKPDGRWVTTGSIRDIDVPSSVADLVKARIADLRDEEREVLDLAACLGFLFDADLIAAVRSEGALPTLRCLARLEGKHRLVHGHGDRFVFDHHQVQEVVYAALPPRLAVEYHAAIAVAILARDPSPTGEAAVMLVEHSLRGRMGAAGAGAIPPALDHLEAGYERDRALSLLDRALAVPGLLVGGERGRLLLRRATLLGRLGRLQAQGAAIGDAVSLAEGIADEPLLARVLMLRALWHLEAGEFDEGRADSERVGALAERTGQRSLAAEAVLTAARTDFGQGRLEDARARAARALDLAREAGDRRLEATAHRTLGVVAIELGDLEEARAHITRKLEYSREVGDLDGEVNALTTLGAVHARLGRKAATLGAYEQALAAARRCGSRLEEGMLLANIAEVLRGLGRFDEAREDADRAADIFREAEHRWGEALVLGIQGITSLYLGRYEEAGRYHDLRSPLIRKIGDAVGEAVASYDRGNLLQYLGDLTGAMAAFDESIRRTGALGLKYTESYGRWGRAVVLWQQGDARAAREEMERVVALRRAQAASEGLAEALVDLGELLLEVGETVAALAALQEGVALAIEIDSPSFAGLGAVRLSRLTGDTEGARATLDRFAPGMIVSFRMEARFRLWKLTHDASQLEEAHGLFLGLLEHAPESCRSAMRENVPLHREILAAAKEAGL